MRRTIFLNLTLLFTNMNFGTVVAEVIDQSLAQRIRERVSEISAEHDIPATFVVIATPAGAELQMAIGRKVDNSTLHPAGPIEDLLLYALTLRLLEDSPRGLSQTVELDGSVEGVHIAGGPLTVRQLLAQQTGLPFNFVKNSADHPYEVKTTERNFSILALEVLARWIQKRLGVEPATYLERVTVEVFGRKLFRLREALPNSTSKGQLLAHDGRILADHYSSQVPTLLGASFVANDDVAKLLTNLLEPSESESLRFLSPKSFERFVELCTDDFAAPQVFANQSRLARATSESGLIITGSDNGYTTALKIQRDSIAVCVSLASERFCGVAEQIVHDIERIVSGEASTEEYFPLDRRKARRFSGRWCDRDHWLELNEYQGELYLRMESGITTLSRQGKQHVTAGRLGNGVAVHFTEGLTAAEDSVTVSGRTYQRHLNRPHPVMTTWEPFIGKYTDVKREIYVLEWCDKLQAMINGVDFYTLIPTDENDTFLMISDWHAAEPITFLRDPSGIVSSLHMLHSGASLDRITKNASNFRIEPIGEIDEIRGKALKATPPSEPVNDTPPLVDLKELLPSLRLDIRYASENNFMGDVFYDEPRAFLRRPAAEALKHIVSALEEDGLGLVVYDAYRPWFVTKMFWDATPDNLKHFVADPNNGSRHNRGAAVDVGLYNLADDQVFPAPSGYDEFNESAYPLFPGGTTLQRWSRDRLRRQMEHYGFSVYQYEWWHFDYLNWSRFPIENKTFSELTTQ